MTIQTGLSPADLVACQLDTYNAQDVEGHCACYADDLIATNLNGEVTLRGVPALRAMLEQMFAEFPQNHAELKTRIVIGDVVIDHEHVTRGPDGPQFEVAAIYTIANGKIVRVDFVK
ncbi:nuclear transport factor 2 family protein [Phenylobacterium sp.]|uniref:nuclear transport factor 2 family protein n=1 Tax=Phenylobacterium sp. TaxID=1871053 RepID=UPI0035B32D0A